MLHLLLFAHVARRPVPVIDVRRNYGQSHKHVGKGVLNWIVKLDLNRICFYKPAVNILKIAERMNNNVCTMKVSHQSLVGHLY